MYLAHAFTRLCRSSRSSVPSLLLLLEALHSRLQSPQKWTQAGQPWPVTNTMRRNLTSAPRIRKGSSLVLFDSRSSVAPVEIKKNGVFLKGQPLSYSGKAQGIPRYNEYNARQLLVLDSRTEKENFRHECPGTS